MKRRTKKPPVILDFVNKSVWFFDNYHGFWRPGVCYKETDKIAHIRLSTGSLYKVFKSRDTIKWYDPLDPGSDKCEPWDSYSKIND